MRSRPHSVRPDCCGAFFCGRRGVVNQMLNAALTERSQNPHTRSLWCRQSAVVYIRDVSPRACGLPASSRDACPFTVCWRVFIISISLPASCPTYSSAPGSLAGISFASSSRPSQSENSDSDPSRLSSLRLVNAGGARWVILRTAGVPSFGWQPAVLFALKARRAGSHGPQPVVARRVFSWAPSCLFFPQLRGSLFAHSRPLVGAPLTRRQRHWQSTRSTLVDQDW